MTDPTSTDPTSTDPPGDDERCRARRGARVGAGVVGRPARPGARGALGACDRASGSPRCVVSLGFGVTTASVDMSLGPHPARYDVTTDATVTVDLGPLGTLQIDSPLPLTLGVRATVQEIPADLTELDAGDDAPGPQRRPAGLPAVLHRPRRPTLQDVARRARRWTPRCARAGTLVAALRGPGGWSCAARRGAPPRAGAGCARTPAGSCRRRHRGRRSPGRPSSRRARSRPVAGRFDAPASAVFDGTPLEGARVTGRLGGVIDTYGGYVVDALRENKEFYAAADDALVVAWGSMAQRSPSRRPASAEARPRCRCDPTAATDDRPRRRPTDAGGADRPASRPDRVAERLGAPPTAHGHAGRGARRDPVVLVVVSDLHCNVGMAPVIGTLATPLGGRRRARRRRHDDERHDRRAVLRDDLRAGGALTGCRSSCRRATTTPPRRPRMYARAGATVLDGEVVEVDGLRILGDNDPNETRIGAGGTARRRRSRPPRRARRLADVACDDGERRPAADPHPDGRRRRARRRVRARPGVRALPPARRPRAGRARASATSARAPPARRSRSRRSGPLQRHRRDDGAALRPRRRGRSWTTSWSSVHTDATVPVSDRAAVARASEPVAPTRRPTTAARRALPPAARRPGRPAPGAPPAVTRRVGARTVRQVRPGRACSPGWAGTRTRRVAAHGGGMRRRPGDRGIGPARAPGRAALAAVVAGGLLLAASLAASAGPGEDVLRPGETARAGAGAVSRPAARSPRGAARRLARPVRARRRRALVDGRRRAGVAPGHHRRRRRRPHGARRDGGVEHGDHGGGLGAARAGRRRRRRGSTAAGPCTGRPARPWCPRRCARRRGSPPVARWRPPTAGTCWSSTSGDVRLLGPDGRERWSTATRATAWASSCGRTATSWWPTRTASGCGAAAPPGRTPRR